MTRSPERFAFIVLMLCLIAAWAEFIPFDMNQVFIAYLIFWAAWTAWFLLGWWRADAIPDAREALAPREPKGIDLDRDEQARRRFIEGDPV